jgi:GT2 family glycosyltransferase
MMHEKGRKNSNDALVSVIIPTWNRKDDLRIALASVFKQGGVKYEVIVVDNASSDGTLQMVQNKFQEVILIENERNLGTSLAKNQGFIHSKGDYCHFLDSDAELIDKLSLKTMVDLLAANPDIGCIGGEVYPNPNGTVEHKKKIITFNGETLTLSIEQSNYEMLNVGYLATCNMMIPRELMERCGGFDNFITYAGEDKELGYKVNLYGYRNVVDSRCLAYHRFSKEGRASNFYLFHRNRIRFVVKNYPLLTIVCLPFLDFIAMFSLKRFQSIKMKEIDITRWQHKQKFDKIGIVQTFLSLVLGYAVSLILAYAWNLLHIPQTVWLRFFKESYVEVLRRGDST